VSEDVTRQSPEEGQVETPDEATADAADSEGFVERSPEQVATVEETPSGEAPKPDDAALVAARAEAQEYKDRWLRAAAELENVRRRAAREQLELIERAGERILRQVLEPLDNLERAINAARRNNASAEAGNAEAQARLLEGIEMVYGQCMALLEQENVRPMETVGRPFDPNVHEALLVVERADQPPNTVVEEAEKGYWFGERVLRHAKVVVSRAPVVSQAAESDRGEKANTKEW